MPVDITKDDNQVFQTCVPIWVLTYMSTKVQLQPTLKPLLQGRLMFVYQCIKRFYWWTENYIISL